MLLSEFFETVYRPRRLRGKSEETSRLYRYTIRSFAKTLGRQPELKDLTDDNVSRHMQTVLDNGRAVATANKDRQQLLTIWRYATQRGKHNTWPDVQAEKEPQRVPAAWLIEDLQKLFAHIDTLDGELSGVPRCLWWRAILMVCLDTGERIGAVRKAEWKWLEHEWILFPAEVRKGGKRDRRYSLSQSTLTVLARVRKHARGDAMFPWPYCDVYLWTKFNQLLKGCGLPHGRRDKFHRLRRTTASVVYAAGGDATEALDHTHRRTTQRYLDPRFSRETQASKMLADWLRAKPGEAGKKTG